MKFGLPHRWVAVVGRSLLVAGGLAVLVGTIAWLSGMFEEKVSPGWSEAQGATIHDQPTDVVHEVHKSYVEEAIGTLKASSRTVVSAKILATIDEISVKAGDQVVAGQVLIQLDGKQQQSRLDQSKQALEAAVANRKQAEQHFDRISALEKQNAASRSDHDMARRDLRVAIANESESRQAVSEASVLLSYATIQAAKDGRIVDRLSEPGDTAKPGEPILVLYDASSLRLEAPVMEQIAFKLKAGDQLKVYVDAMNREFDATVDEIVPQADAPSRSFLVKASLPKSDDLYEGMFGRLQIPTGERRHLCLADDAVVHIGQLEFVDVVLPNGTLERRLIKSGQLGIPGRHEVLSGVKAGERVVLYRDSSQDGGPSGETSDAIDGDAIESDAENGDADAR